MKNIKEKISSAGNHFSGPTPKQLVAIFQIIAYIGIAIGFNTPYWLDWADNAKAGLHSRSDEFKLAVQRCSQEKLTTFESTSLLDAAQVFIILSMIFGFFSLVNLIVDAFGKWPNSLDFMHCWLPWWGLWIFTLLVSYAVGTHYYIALVKECDASWGWSFILGTISWILAVLTPLYGPAHKYVQYKGYRSFFTIFQRTSYSEKIVVLMGVLAIIAGALISVSFGMDDWMTYTLTVPGSSKTRTPSLGLIRACIPFATEDETICEKYCDGKFLVEEVGNSIKDVLVIDCSTSRVLRAMGIIAITFAWIAVILFICCTGLLPDWFGGLSGIISVIFSAITIGIFSGKKGETSDSSEARYEKGFILWHVGTWTLLVVCIVAMVFGRKSCDTDRCGVDYDEY